MIFLLSLILLVTPSSKNEPNMTPSFLRLCGVVVSENKSASVAVLKNGNTEKILILGIEDSIDGFQLIHVLKDRIVLQKETNTYLIFLYGDQMHQIQPRHQKELETIEKTRSKDIFSKAIKQSPVILKKEIIRSEFEIRVNQEWTQIMNETRFLPYVAEGKIRGFKLTKVAQRGILSDLGIQQNDIVVAINNIEINSVSSLYRFISIFKTADRILVDIERKGYPIQILYLLK